MAAVSTFGLELDGDPLFLRGGERLVNDGIEEGEDVHSNQVCGRGWGWSAGGALREPESSGGGTKDIGACPVITGPTYIRRTCCALGSRSGQSSSTSSGAALGCRGVLNDSPARG